MRPQAFLRSPYLVRSRNRKSPLEVVLPILPSQNSPTEKKLQTHIEAQHHQFASQVQLPALLRASRHTIDRIPAAACSLCDWESILKNHNAKNPSNETLVVTLDQFRRHLGSHMEQLALFALPRIYKDESKSANSNEAFVEMHSGTRRQVSIGSGTISWKSTSSRSGNRDDDNQSLNLQVNQKETSGKKLVELHSRTSHMEVPSPWKKLPMMFAHGYKSAFPRYHASTSQYFSRNAELYFHGGLINETTVKGDLGVVKAGEGLVDVHQVSTYGQGPGPRVGAAAAQVRDHYYLWGGDTRIDEEDMLDSALYLLETGR